MPFRGWDFMRQFTVGMVVVTASVFLTVVIAGVCVQQANAMTDRLAGVYARSALAATELESQLERRSGFAREYLLTGDARALRREQDEALSFERTLPELRSRARQAEGRALLDRIDAAELKYASALADTLRACDRHDGDVAVAFEGRVVPSKDELANLLSAYEALKEQQFVDAEAASTTTTTRAVALVGAVAALALVAAVVLAALLWRGVRALTQGKALITASLERVEQSNRDLDAFAGRVAHDLRGALGPVLMAPKLLRAGLSPQRAEAVGQRIERSVTHAVGLVDALLAFSRAASVPGGPAPRSSVEPRRQLDQYSG